MTKISINILWPWPTDPEINMDETEKVNSIPFIVFTNISYDHLWAS